MSENSGGQALKAGSWYVFSNFLIKGVGIFTTPIITRLINPTEYGIYNTYKSMLVIMSIIGTLNILTSIAVARFEYEDEEEYSAYISSVVGLSTISVTVIYLISRLLIQFFGNPLDIPMLLIDFMYFNILLTNTFDVLQTKHRSQLKYKQFVFFSLLVSIVAPILSIILVSLQDSNKYIGYVLGTNLPIMIIGVALYYVIFKQGRTFYNKEYWKYALNISVPLIPHSLSNNLLSQSDRVLISTYRNATEVGLYSLAYSYSAILMTIWNALNQAWAPWFYGEMNNENYKLIQKIVKPYTVLFSMMFIGMLALGPEALKIFGSTEYQDGVRVIPPVLLGLYFQFSYSLYVNIEIYLKQTKYISTGTLMAAVLNIVLNILVIPTYGYIGAAYTTLIGYIFLYVVHYYMSNKILEGADVIGNRFIVFWSLFMVAISFIFNFLTEYLIIRYILLVVIFAVILMLFRKEIPEVIKLSKTIFKRK